MVRNVASGAIVRVRRLAGVVDEGGGVAARVGHRDLVAGRVIGGKGDLVQGVGDRRSASAVVVAEGRGVAAGVDRLVEPSGFVVDLLGDGAVREIVFSSRPAGSYS